MKLSPKNVILFAGASALMLVDAFAEPLGIPANLKLLPGIAAVCCLLPALAGVRVEADGQFPQMSEERRKKWSVFMVAMVAATCGSGPFVLPATGVRLPLHTWIAISIFAFALAIAIWQGSRVRTRK